MKFHEAAELISNLPPQQSILLAGPPGIGKSTLCEFVMKMDEQRAIEEAKKAGKEHMPAYGKVCDLACYMPEDLLGVPFKQSVKINGSEMNVTKHAPQSWMAELSVPNRYGMLLLDDIGAAAKSVQVAAFRIVQERQAGDFTLSDNVRVICTTNRREDKSGASALPAALMNRMIVLSIEPSAEEWCIWSREAGLPVEIYGYIKYRPQNLSRAPKDADKRGAFATPRSWEKLGRCLDAAKKLGMVSVVAEGLVGEGVATEFSAFVRMANEVPDALAILDNPERALPVVPTGEPDKLIAIGTAIAEHAARKIISSKSTKDQAEWASKYITALAHICEKAFEYSSVSVTAYTSTATQSKADKSKLISALVVACKTAPKNGKTKKLLVKLKKALTGED